MANTPRSEAARWLARAEEAAGDRNVPVDQVIALYQKALALDPSLVEGWADLGVCFAMLERWDEAMAAFGRGLALDGHHRRCLLYRGDTLKRKGDKAGAVQAYQALVTAHADDASAWVKYGTALDLAGRLDEALAAMERALALRPQFIDAVNGKARVEAHMGRMPAGGIPLDTSPGQFMRALAEAQVAQIEQEMAEAAAAAQPPAPAESATADACHARAQALLAAGEPGQAVAYLEKALKLAPRHVPALEAISATLGKLGRPQESLAWCEKWLAHPLLKDRDRARAFCAKGICLRQTNDFVKALVAVDKALVLDPGNVAIAKERAATVAAARGAHGTITPTPSPRPAGPRARRHRKLETGAGPRSALRPRVAQQRHGRGNPRAARPGLRIAPAFPRARAGGSAGRPRRPRPGGACRMPPAPGRGAGHRRRRPHAGTLQSGAPGRSRGPPRRRHRRLSRAVGRRPHLLPGVDESRHLPRGA